MAAATLKAARWQRSEPVVWGQPVVWGRDRSGWMSENMHGMTRFGMGFVPELGGSRHHNLPIYCKRSALSRNA